VEVKVFNWFDPSNTTNKYSDKILTFKVEEARTMLKVAYACTAHKVQGQEFDYVILPMSMGYGVMLYRNLVYTAITRAKRKAFVMGDVNAFLVAASNTRDMTRNSYLSHFIDA
jgi:exodeoxyribonuclease V alpha subunit